jgi:hypothetical protein
MLLISQAEKQQEAALHTLSGYKIERQPVLYDDLKPVTARSYYMPDER